jgi:hypothetical protein
VRTFQLWDGGHDGDGNPQRLFMVYEYIEDESYPFWRLVEVYDEGYHGKPSELRHMAEMPKVEVSASVYRLTLAAAEGAQLRRWGE